jgi:hypothetical protein
MAIIVEQIEIVIVEQDGIAGFILNLGVQVCANQLFPHLLIRFVVFFLSDELLLIIGHEIIYVRWV